MNLIRVRDNIPQWPYTVAMLRTDEPRLSISARPHAGELAALQALDPPIYVYLVQPTPPPQLTNPAEQTLKQVHPVLFDGVWQQRWEVVDLPPAPPQDPEPQWVAFGAAVLFHPAIRAFAAANPVDYPPLTLGFGQAAQGDTQTLMMLWPSLRQAGIITPELAAIVADIATAHHLPAEFIEGLAA